ncbi:MAG TPA: hypothetical protein VEU30_08790 [Thermoanaerobaculia bacterium]|nr:hypothetical protein [Thermoanaerobaculia bacterium]
MKLYEPLIERDLDAIPDAVRAFLAERSPHELFLAVARFAVLAYAPSQHAKRAVMACRAAWDLRDAMGEQWPTLLSECARYAAESRQPWSEPPIFGSLAVPDETQLRANAKGDALLLIDAAQALLPILGEKGKAALLRMPVQEIEADPNPPADNDAPIEQLIDRVVASQGSIDTVRDVFIWSAKHPATQQPSHSATPIYRLARDYAQTLIAHATPLPATLRDPFLAAVHHNLAHGESFAEWSFA